MSSRSNSRRSTIISLIILSIVALIYLWEIYQSHSALKNFELNRNAKISYSKHAKCRMKCRHIDKKEVEEVLEEGKINPKKSQMDKGKFAMEDITEDNQNVRVIFAIISKNKLHVVTTIDLDNHWQCNCR